MQETLLENGMVAATFEIKGKFFKENCLPGLNDLLAEATKHPVAYNRLKKDMEWAVSCAIRRDLKGFKAPCRVRLDITWGEKNKGARRDYDNVVSAGRKIINDTLTKTGVIQDDNPKYLGYGNNYFNYAEKPFIRVKIVVDEENIHEQN